MTLGFFDIAFMPADPEVAPPTTAQRTTVLQAAGRIVHEFQVPMVRAVLRIESVQQLPALWLKGVQDTTVFEVSAMVRWASADSVANEAILAQVGATSRTTFQARDMEGNSVLLTVATLPDAAIPILRAHPSVASILNEPIAACTTAVPQ